MKIKVFTVLTLAVALFLIACGKNDADLQKSVTDKLAAEKITGVTVAVKDGVATLTGEVQDITVKNKADAAAKVEGIKSVDNKLTTKPLQAPTPAPPDPMLKGKIEENLKKAGCTGAKVEVKESRVHLSGTVPEAKYAECFKVASESGTVKVENELQKGK